MASFLSLRSLAAHDAGPVPFCELPKRRTWLQQACRSKASASLLHVFFAKSCGETQISVCVPTQNVRKKKTSSTIQHSEINIYGRRLRTRIEVNSLFLVSYILLDALCTRRVESQRCIVYRTGIVHQPTHTLAVGENSFQASPFKWLASDTHGPNT